MLILITRELSYLQLAKCKIPNYLFTDLKLAKNVQPGTFEIQFTKNNLLVDSYKYELKSREKGSAARTGFNTSDVICLITPDRFVNGDTNNDEIEGMKEKLNRADKWGRHAETYVVL